jgi:hypothetical protein
MNLYANLSIEMCSLAAIKLSGKEEELRNIVLNWTAECMFREINPAELADDAMQLIRVHNNRSVDAVERIEKVIADEISAWNKKIQDDANTAIKAVKSMREWLSERDGRKKKKKAKWWCADSYGLQWWVSMDILSIDRRCVILAALETGNIEEGLIDKLTQDLKFGKKGMITKHYAKEWYINNNAHWPSDWRAAWEAGEMHKEYKAFRRDKKAVIAL